MASSTLVLPALGSLYQALGPFAEALLRMIAGLILLPHGLRAGFGFYVSSMTSYSAIYGALAAVPVFLLWIYLDHHESSHGVSFSAERVKPCV